MAEWIEGCSRCPTRQTAHSVCIRNDAGGRDRDHGCLKMVVDWSSQAEWNGRLLVIARRGAFDWKQLARSQEVEVDVAPEQWHEVCCPKTLCHVNVGCVRVGVVKVGRRSGLCE